jgi:hypothetical protein
MPIQLHYIDTKILFPKAERMPKFTCESELEKIMKNNMPTFTENGDMTQNTPICLWNTKKIN